jgi:hypothetical protein
MNREIINFGQELKDDKEFRILRLKTIMALCDPDEIVRLKNFMELNQRVSGNIAMGFVGDNQLFLVNHYGRIYYMGDMPKTYLGDITSCYSFDYRIKSLDLG